MGFIAQRMHFLCIRDTEGSLHPRPEAAGVLFLKKQNFFRKNAKPTPFPTRKRGYPHFWCGDKPGGRPYNILQQRYNKKGIHLAAAAIAAKWGTCAAGSTPAVISADMPTEAEVAPFFFSSLINSPAVLCGREGGSLWKKAERDSGVFWYVPHCSWG